MYVCICCPLKTYNFTVVMHGAMVLLEYHHISLINDARVAENSKGRDGRPHHYAAIHLLYQWHLPANDSKLQHSKHLPSESTTPKQRIGNTFPKNQHSRTENDSGNNHIFSRSRVLSYFTQDWTARKI